MNWLIVPIGAVGTTILVVLIAIIGLSLETWLLNRRLRNYYHNKWRVESEIDRAEFRARHRDVFPEETDEFAHWLKDKEKLNEYIGEVP